MEDLVGREFGPYRIGAALGAGGMATVYKAYQQVVDRHVAIKVLRRDLSADRQYLARFRHEAKIVARLQHPHILPIFDFGESEGYLFLAMPLVTGGTLARACRSAVTPAVAEPFIKQICDALTYAHGKGIVHRDLKPTNILLDESRNCLVADFGIAHLAGDATALTVAGSVMGTPAYMSPEQAAGTDVGPWSDVYSLGIILYEMLTGRVPFKADTPVAVALMHLTAPLPPPRTFNPALTASVETVLLKALARTKEERYASAREFATAFSNALVPSALASQDPLSENRHAPTIGMQPGEPARPTVAELPAHDSSGGRMHRWLIGASLAIVVGVGVYLWTAIRPTPAKSPMTAVESGTTAAAAPVPVPVKPTALPAPRSVPTPPIEHARSTQTPPPTDGRNDATPSATAQATKVSPTGAGVTQDTTRASPAMAVPAKLTPDEYPAAIAQYTRLCNAGRLVDCTNLGVMYMNGFGVPKDYGRAVALYRQSCDGGNPLGCAHLGTMYQSGRGAMKDENKAIALLRQACDGGNNFGCNRLHALQTNRRGDRPR